MTKEQALIEDLNAFRCAALTMTDEQIDNQLRLAQLQAWVADQKRDILLLERTRRMYETVNVTFDEERKEGA
jgi:hypothetical protein